MIARFATVLACVLAFSGCSKRETSDSAESQIRIVDACSLLTSQDIEAIQGAPVKEAKSSEKIERDIVVSQCYFMLPTAADSIIVTVMRKENSSVARGPRELWQETFYGKKKEREEEEEEEKGEKGSPQKIEGLGDEAFWNGLQFGGTLHVLKGDYNIRISVGGPGDTATQVQKLKSLAAVILKRL